MGQGRGRETVVEVTQGEQGVAFSINGSPPRPVPWVEGLTFRQGARALTFRRANGDTGPVTELRFSTPSVYAVLKKQ